MITCRPPEHVAHKASSSPALAKSPSTEPPVRRSATPPPEGSPAVTTDHNKVEGSPEGTTAIHSKSAFSPDAVKSPCHAARVKRSSSRKDGSTSGHFQAASPIFTKQLKRTRPLDQGATRSPRSATLAIKLQGQSAMPPKTTAPSQNNSRSPQLSQAWRRQGSSSATLPKVGEADAPQSPATKRARGVNLTESIAMKPSQCDTARDIPIPKENSELEQTLKECFGTSPHSSQGPAWSSQEDPDSLHASQIAEAPSLLDPACTFPMQQMPQHALPSLLEPAETPVATSAPVLSQPPDTCPHMTRLSSSGAGESPQCPLNAMTSLPACNDCRAAMPSGSLALAEMPEPCPAASPVLSGDADAMQPTSGSHECHRHMAVLPASGYAVGLEANAEVPDSCLLGRHTKQTFPSTHDGLQVGTGGTAAASTEFGSRSSLRGAVRVRAMMMGACLQSPGQIAGALQVSPGALSRLNDALESSGCLGKGDQGPGSAPALVSGNGNGFMERECPAALHGGVMIGECPAATHVGVMIGKCPEALHGGVIIGEEGGVHKSTLAAAVAVQELVSMGKV
jgi:hypothetical protein